MRGQVGGQSTQKVGGQSAQKVGGQSAQKVGGQSAPKPIIWFDPDNGLLGVPPNQAAAAPA